MSHLVSAVNKFFWFVFQAIIVGGIGFQFFAIGIVTATILMWLTLPDQRAPDRGRFLYLAALPAVWIFMGLWGSWFWRAWETGAPPNPQWTIWLILAGPIVALALSIWLIWWLRGARLFVLVFSVVNLYFVFAMYLLAAMAITGDWL
jgi:hypothetical protein